MKKVKCKQIYYVAFFLMIALLGSPAISVEKTNDLETKLINAADAGDLDAQLKIAKLYRSGSHEYQIRPRQITRAIKYYQMASDQGSTEADFQLGYIYMTQPDFLDYNKAKNYLERASEHNYGEAQFFLASLHESGDIGIKDMALAEYYFLLSGKNGYSQSYSVLADTYHYGYRGKAIDYKKAIEYYELAAQGGNRYSLSVLGRIYLEGKLTPKDINKARYWLNSSCKNGYSPSCDELRKLSSTK